eukprot:TRINITY_DN14425_c0_g2_i1.p1 TRINITY_DN14425_c0_g2~~TRINITY_DN14425_c0_g2_i1.p1  ORF type:complete len:599 (-),score=210.04 TRINITY_DN14425_c0_g2_i1:614-2365(-)
MWESSFMQTAVLICVLFAVAMVVADACTLLLTLTIFMKPLERMARFLRTQGNMVNLDEVKQLAKRRHLFLPVLMLAVVSPTVAVGYLYWVRGHMLAAFATRVTAAPGITSMAYRLKMTQMSLGFYGTSLNGAIKDLLQAPTDPDLRATVKIILSAESKNRQIEYATLVGADGRIVLTPNNANRTGAPFDPAGLVTAALNTSQRYMRTTWITWEEFQAEHAPVIQEHVTPNLPVSELHPNTTHRSGLIRFGATPVWSGDDTSGPPDGVLISGDIVDGNTAIPERSNNILTRGYSAIYSWTQEAGFRLATSAMMKPGNSTNAWVDVALPSTEILEKVRDFGYGSKRVATAMMDIRGIKHSVAARCVCPNFLIGSLGVQDEVEPYDGVPQCQAIMVQAMPWSAVEGIDMVAMKWHYAGLAMQAVKTAALVLLCKRAYSAFKRVILHAAGTKQARRSHSGGHHPPKAQKRRWWAMTSDDIPSSSDMPEPAKQVETHHHLSRSPSMPSVQEDEYEKGSTPPSSPPPPLPATLPHQGADKSAGTSGSASGSQSGWLNLVGHKHRGGGAPRVHVCHDSEAAPPPPKPTEL